MQIMFQVKNQAKKKKNKSEINTFAVNADYFCHAKQAMSKHEHYF